MKFVKGSARSNKNVAMGTFFMEALEEKLLIKGGGHELAAGLQSKKKIYKI